MTQKVMTNDEEATGLKKIFVAIFGTFGRYVTNFRGTFVENVKKSLKSTHPNVQVTNRICWPQERSYLITGIIFHINFVHQ
jgi:hypothetical protein